MLEQHTVQSRGFKNVSENGKVIGFQVAIRSKYYRGVWLSQLRPAEVIVDGVNYTGDQVTWTIGSKTYEQADLKNYGEINWDLLEPAILTVRLPGGLTQGIHEVNVIYTYSSSYMPPSMDTRIGMMRQEEPRRLILV